MLHTAIAHSNMLLKLSTTVPTVFSAVCRSTIADASGSEASKGSQQAKAAAQGEAS
jgi:hypothetical protein